MQINSHYLKRLVFLFLHFIEKLRRTRAHQRNYPNLEVIREKLWLVTVSLIHKRKKRDLKICVCVCVCNRDTAGIKMQLSGNRKETQGERRPSLAVAVTASEPCPTDRKQALNIPHPWECRSWPGIVKACPACGAEISLNLASNSGHEPRLLWVEEIWFSAAVARKLSLLLSFIIQIS